MKTKEIKQYVREPYAWPGGYQKVLVMADGAVLCPECTRENYCQIVTALYDYDRRNGWYPLAVEILWEGDEYCDHCQKLINAVYSEDEEDDEPEEPKIKLTSEFPLLKYLEELDDKYDER